ncbi:MAG: histidinol-phosphate transaminase [Plesiomonas sp.]|uniref:histidinol-phosphate transaminase n=1 Tax=Plesiomonas sp. TaxID=2486279 RepID=UPI003EE59114
MSCDFTAYVNTGIRGLSPYQAGKPVEELERELGISNIVKLASNENPLGLAPSVQQALTQALSDLSRYPDANGFYLKQTLAAHFGTQEAQITLGNGSNDLLEMIARVFVSEQDEVIYAQHAFIVYPLVVQALNAHAVVVPAREWGHDLSAMLAAITAKTKLIFIANPNNPTGTFLETAELADFLQQVPPHVMVVLDEAYTEFVPLARRSPSIEWVENFPNLIVCRTFSKAYGLAGLRIGYAVSHPEVAGLLNRLRQPFNCSSLALLAAQTVLADDAYLAASVENNRQGMQQLITFCQQKGIAYIPSLGNFITLDMGQPAAPLYQQLLQQGVIVRPIAGYGMPNHLRVSIGLPHENQRFIDALTPLLA